MKKTANLGIILIAALIFIASTHVHAQTYQQITTITGSSDQTTNYFTIPSSEWRIVWSFTPDPHYPEYSSLYVFVYPQGETSLYVDSFSANNNKTSGTEYIHQGDGSFYLKIIAANTPGYTMTIEAQPSTATPTPKIPEYPVTAVLLVTFLTASIALIFTKKNSVKPWVRAE